MEIKIHQKCPLSDRKGSLLPVKVTTISKSATSLRNDKKYRPQSGFEISRIIYLNPLSESKSIRPTYGEAKGREAIMSNVIAFPNRFDISRCSTRKSDPRDDLIEKLFVDMSVTLIALGQVIINSMHDEKHIVRIQEVDIFWLNMCPIMSRSEWLIGTHALIHYCETMRFEAALEAIEILDQPEDLYKEYSRMLRGAEQRRGKNRNAGTFERSLVRVRANYLGYE